MPRIKEILHTARLAQASTKGRQRICRGDRKNHTIAPGSWYLTVKDGLNEKSYCLVCARVILNRGKTKLDSLLKDLNQIDNSP